MIQLRIEGEKIVCDFLLEFGILGSLLVLINSFDIFVLIEFNLFYENDWTFYRIEKLLCR